MLARSVLRRSYTLNMKKWKENGHGSINEIN